jgi:diguanylate cyclase (GGDEF)-like protein
LGIVLLEETQSQAYRIGDDEFVAFLIEGSQTEHAQRARAIYERLNNQAHQFGLQVPAATITVIHYSGDEQISPSDVLIQLGATIFDVKSNLNGTFKIFNAAQLNPPNEVRWIADLMVERIVALANMLDESNHLAYTDPLTGLPNMRAAQRQFEAAIVQASTNAQPMAVLLIDGDDLRRYNEISYAAGDEMIQRLGATLKDQLRPGDFLARWRIGDEFLVLLPDTSCTQAVVVGKRLCAAVQEASQGWHFPVTISIGVACYSQTDQTSPSTAGRLLLEAEEANDQAKSIGKNCVIAAS